MAPTHVSNEAIGAAIIRQIRPSTAKTRISKDKIPSDMKDTSVHWRRLLGFL
jgi:hypothetical protein